MLPESCRSRMVGILAAVWRLVPPCPRTSPSPSARGSSPSVLCFPLYPLLLQSREYIKVHAFLPNITCVHEQTDLPFHAPRSYSPASTAHEVALYVLAAGKPTHRGFLLYFFLFLFRHDCLSISASDLYSFFRLAHFNISTF